MVRRAKVTSISEKAQQALASTTVQFERGADNSYHFSEALNTSTGVKTIHFGPPFMAGGKDFMAVGETLFLKEERIDKAESE